MSDTVAVTSADAAPAVLQPTLTDAIAAAQSYALQSTNNAAAAASLLTTFTNLAAAASGSATAAAASASSALTVATDAANAAIAMLRANAPAALDTLLEISAAINNDPSFASTVMTALAGKAAKGANADITSLTGLLTALSIAQGGTGATTPAGARTALGAAASGSNSDITSLSALSTPLSAQQGGTGIASYTIGDIIYATNTTTLGRLAAVPTGNVLLSGGVGAASFWGKVDLTAHVTGRTGPANMAQAPATTLRGNTTGGTADVADSTLSAHLKAAFGAVRGTMIVMGATDYVARVPTAAGQIPTFDGNDTNFTAPGALSQAPRSAVRQTVQGGPQSAGVPSFLPSTAASLTLTTQNVSTGANALTVAAAQGYNGTGQNDVVSQLTSNPSWTLTASANNYLFINAQTGATSIQTLQPIYQFGGTISTANGQFTFDYQAMIGYLGNGTTAVATPLVCVGEAVTSASAVTSTIAYAYNGFFDPGWTATLPGTASVVNYNHNLGVAPLDARVWVLTTTAQGGYAVGDVFAPATAVAAGTYSPFMPWGQRNTGGFQTGAQIAFLLIVRNTGSALTMTAANFSYKTIFRRGWGGA